MYKACWHQLGNGILYQSAGYFLDFAKINKNSCVSYSISINMLILRGHFYLSTKLFKGSYFSTRQIFHSLLRDNGKWTKCCFYICKKKKSWNQYDKRFKLTKWLFIWQWQKLQWEISSAWSIATIQH